MKEWLVDALYFALRFIGVVVLLEGLALLVAWRVSVVYNSIARRASALKCNNSSTDDWFSPAAQKELYRDFSV